tara:strand:+ start:111 stop:380 length:270 start_codon:yes stop_codon:yes gene_type:complete
MILLIIALTLVTTASLFIIINLIKKNEKLDDILKKYESFIEKQSEAVNTCNERLKEIDHKGVFYADDEIGFFFKEVQKIQEALNEFTLK